MLTLSSGVKLEVGASFYMLEERLRVWSPYLARYYVVASLILLKGLITDYLVMTGEYIKRAQASSAGPPEVVSEPL